MATTYSTDAAMERMINALPNVGTVAFVAWLERMGGHQLSGFEAVCLQAMHRAAHAHGYEQANTLADDWCNTCPTEAQTDREWLFYEWADACVEAAITREADND